MAESAPGKDKEKNVGRVVQIIGPVLDVEFPGGHLPAIYNAVVIQDEGQSTGQPIDVDEFLAWLVGGGFHNTSAVELPGR